MNTRLLLAALVMIVLSQQDAYGQFDMQQGWVIPPRDPRQRRLLKERVVLYAGPAARGFVESREYGDVAALALSMCSQGVAVQWVAFHASGGFDTLPRKRDFLRVIAQPGCRDAVAVFVMQHANQMYDPNCAHEFLAYPLDYSLGQKQLPFTAAEKPSKCLETEEKTTRSDRPSKTQPRSVNSALPYVSPADQRGYIAIAVVIGLLVFCLWMRRRRIARESPA
jgi:hypothetical protein